MAKNTVFILLIFGLLLSSCKKNVEEIKPAVYDFEVVKTFEVLLQESERNIRINGYPYYLVEVEGAPVLIVNVYHKKLSFYDIESGKKFHEILTDQTWLLDSFRYINKDSIFCYYFGDYDDSNPVKANYGQIQLIDYYGKVKQKYKYNTDHIELENCNLKIENILPPSNTESYLPILEGNLFFSARNDCKYLLGTKKFIENPLPILMRYNILEQKFYLSKHNNYPYVKEGIYYPTEYKSKYVLISGSGLPLIRFIYSSDVFEWDYINDKIITHSLKSRLLDTIKPFAKPARECFDLEEGYDNMFYDKNLGLYFSSLSFMEDFYGKQANGWYLSTIIIANKNFEYLGEIYNNNYFPGELSTKDYIVDYSIKNDSVIEFYYLKLVKTDRDYNEYIDSCRNDLAERRQKIQERKQALAEGYSQKENYIIKFLKNHKKISSSDYTVVTIYAQDGCMGCAESALNLISAKRKSFEEKPFYLIVTARDADLTYQELEGYNLNDFENLIIDSLGVIRNLTVYQGLRNPRLTVVENNNVVLDTIYHAMDISGQLLPGIMKQIEGK